MKTWILIVVLIVISAALRLWGVGAIPPSPDWDEAALGYNAYSILHTGRDEYGAFFPVVMRSFDDYKPALYSYLIIPFLFIFGLTLTAVRMPSILFGIATVIAVFFLSNELFHNKKLSFLIALLLALSPWHIQFSRIAFESNVGLSFNIFGVLFFLKGLKKSGFLFLSVLSFVASMYVYQSEKVFVPLLVVLLVALFWKKVCSLSKKTLIGLCVFGALIAFPMLLYLATNSNAFARAKGVSVFSETAFLKESSARIATDTIHRDIVGLVFDNRRVYIGKEIIANYLSHFDLKWLFITGDISRHHAPFMGLLYLWELPFVLLGIYTLLFSTVDKKVKILIFGWMLLAPIPASVTTGVPHAVRTLNFLPTYQIFVAFGLVSAYLFLAKKQNVVRLTAFSAMSVLIIFNVLYYFNQYFVQLNYYNSLDWQYGYKDAVGYVVAHPQYKRVVVSNQPPLDQSYMFFLFYLQYDPKTYQKETSHVSGGFRENHVFGKYEFRPINWSNEKKTGDTLYVGRPGDFSGNVTVLKTINYLNGEGAIEIVR